MALRIGCLCACVLFGMDTGAADASKLRLQNSQYTSGGAEFYREDAARENSSLSFESEKSGRLRKSLTAAAHVKDEYSSTERWNYLNVYQAYLTFHPNGSALEASLGRKLDTWSSTDDEWRLGVFQPRYLQNKLRPEVAGLTGLFVSGPAQSLRWAVGALPVFIPDLGAHFWIQDNKFMSRNPWFDPPSPAFRFQGDLNEIEYSLNKPRAGQIMNHPGVVAKVEHAWGEAGARLAGAFKPVPQLLLDFPSENHVVVEPAGERLNVEVHPEVIYHWVASTDIWGRVGRWSVGGGLMHDHPLPYGVRPGWTSQTFSPAWVWSASATRALATDDGIGAPKLKLGFLKVENGHAADRGEFSSPQTLFEYRYYYDEAYLAGLAWPVRGLLRSALETELKVVYDRIQNGGALTLGASYGLSKDWRVDGAMDLLGLTGASAENDQSFFSTYRANDRVGMGMSYVF